MENEDIFETQESPVEPSVAPTELVGPNPIETKTLVEVVKPQIIIKSSLPQGQNLAAAVNASVAPTRIPAGLKKFNTSELTNGYFHGVVYGETGVRKTSTAAQFAPPDKARIILTRRKEQMIPLQELGYDVALVEDADAMNFALLYPEKVWPEWKDIEDRTLVFDDGTEGVNILLDEYTEIDGKVVKDKRRTYSAAGNDLRESIKSVLNKQMNFVMVALAKVDKNPITNDESIYPDLPPSMRSMLLTEFEFVFYIKPDTWKLLTDKDFFTYKGFDLDGKEKTYRRNIFAKNKLSLNLVTKNLLAKEESMNLLDIWKKVLAGQAALKNVQKPVTPPTPGTVKTVVTPKVFPVTSGKK